MLVPHKWTSLLFPTVTTTRSQPSHMPGTLNPLGLEHPGTYCRIPNVCRMLSASCQVCQVVNAACWLLTASCRPLTTTWWFLASGRAWWPLAPACWLLAHLVVVSCCLPSASYYLRGAACHLLLGSCCLVAAA